MLAGTLGVLDAPADDPLTDTTEQSQEPPALAVNATQTDLSGNGVAQDCTAASAVETEREEPLIFEGGITSVREPHRVDVVSDLVADVQGHGIVLAERTAGSGRYPFPFDMVAAQTGREITQYDIDIRAFVGQFDEGDIMDTWMVGAEDVDGVTIDYNGNADPETAGQASVGIGFNLSWNDVMAEGVVYESGYVAIYSSWTAALFMEFVADTILPHTVAPEGDGEQQTLGE